PARRRARARGGARARPPRSRARRRRFHRRLPRHAPAVRRARRAAGPRRRPGRPGPGGRARGRPGGMQAMARAGYDPREFLRAFERLAADETADAAGPFFLGSRRGRADRLEAGRDALQAQATTPAPDITARDPAEFELRLRPVLRDNAVLAARAGRF